MEEALQEHKQIKAAVAEITKMEPADEPALGAIMKVLKEYSSNGSHKIAGQDFS